MKRLLIVLIFWALPASADSHRAWRIATVTTSDPRFIVFVDQASVTKVGPYLDAFVLTLFDKNSPVPLNFTMAISKHEVDCAAKQYRVLGVQVSKPSGEQVQIVRTSSWRSTQPYSADQGTLDAICGFRDYQSRIIVDPVGFSESYFLRARR